MILKIASLIGLGIAELALQVNPSAVPGEAGNWLNATVFVGLIGVITWIIKDMSTAREADRLERAQRLAADEKKDAATLKAISDMQASARAEREAFKVDLADIRTYHATQTAVLAASMDRQSAKYDSTIEKLSGLTVATTKLVENMNLAHAMETALSRQRGNTPVPSSTPPSMQGASQ